MGLLRIFIRAFENAYRSVNAVKWKSGISLITILIGSLAITTTFTISKNVDGFVDYLIEENGGPKVSAFNFATDAKFGDEELQKFKQVSVIKKVFGTDAEKIKARFEDKSFMLSLIAVTADNWRHIPYELISGNFISEMDQVNSPNTIVLSKEAVKNFGLLPAIGRFVTVKIKGSDEIRLKVIGVANLKGNDFDRGSAWVNFPLYKELTGKKAVGQLHIVSNEAKWMNWVESFAKELLSKKFGTDIWIYNPLEQFMEQKDQLHIFIQMGYILGFLALIAGSIGSTSVMILNVNLRRREIGLYKSMGFTPFIILLQFSCETLILSLFGGFVGAISGSVLGLLISKDMFPIASLSATGFLLGLASALITGLAFGLIPAFIAAQTDPVKALQG